jgi:hypothetical protein
MTGDIASPPRSQFRSDLRSALTACLASPLLIVVTVLLQAGPTALNAAARNHSLAFLSTIAVVIEFATIGFYGAQRVWLFRLFRESTLPISDAYTLTRGYFGRFFRLGIRMALVMSPFLIAIVAIGATSHSAAAHNALLITAIAGAGGLVIDTLFTFVVPELTFRTASAREAWTSGTALLRESWPHSAWYVLTPGIALLAAANAFGESHRTIWAAGIESALAAMLGLAFKGAILAYYLRLRPDTPDYNPTA